MLQCWQNFSVEQVSKCKDCCPILFFRRVGTLKRKASIIKVIVPQYIASCHENKQFGAPYKYRFMAQITKDCQKSTTVLVVALFDTLSVSSQCQKKFPKNYSIQYLIQHCLPNIQFKLKSGVSIQMIPFKMKYGDSIKKYFNPILTIAYDIFQCIENTN